MPASAPVTPASLLTDRYPVHGVMVRHFRVGAEKGHRFLPFDAVGLCPSYPESNRYHVMGHFVGYRGPQPVFEMPAQQVGVEPQHMSVSSRACLPASVLPGGLAREIETDFRHREARSRSLPCLLQTGFHDSFDSGALKCGKTGSDQVPSFVHGLFSGMATRGRFEGLVTDAPVSRPAAPFRSRDMALRSLPPGQAGYRRRGSLRCSTGTRLFSELGFGWFRTQARASGSCRPPACRPCRLRER